jgi:hypothetical protein
MELYNCFIELGTSWGGVKGNYRIGYSYDLTISNIKQHSSGSHEIMLGFCYNITPPKKITRYKNPRFL